MQETSEPKGRTRRCQGRLLAPGVLSLLLFLLGTGLAQSPASDESAQTCYQRGIDFFRQDRLEDAAEAFEAAVRLESDHLGALKMLGRVRVAQGRLFEAETHFTSALQIDPGDPELHYFLGRLYQTQDLLADAERSFREATRLSPEFARAHAFLGTILYALGNLDEADKSYQRALSADRVAGHADAVIRLEYGLFLQRAGRFDEAVRQLSQGVELSPRNIELHFELSRSLYRQGRLDAAREQLDQALQIDPEEPRVHYLYARICYEQGDQDCGDRHVSLSERGRQP